MHDDWYIPEESIFGHRNRSIEGFFAQIGIDAVAYRSGSAALVQTEPNTSRRLRLDMHFGYKLAARLKIHDSLADVYFVVPGDFLRF